MALETLKDVRMVGGFNVVRTDGNWKSNDFIAINDDENVITFKIQNGAIKENGVNGCQIDTMLEAVKLIVEGLNKKFPCKENAMAITKMDEGLMWMRERTRERTIRGVEGKEER